jgi:hypothetical protein
MEMTTMKKIILSWLFCLTTVSVCGQDVCLYVAEKNQVTVNQVFKVSSGGVFEIR